MSEAKRRKPPLLVKAKEELASWEVIRDQLTRDGETDPQALLDTLEGATELHEALTALYYEMQEREAELDGTKAWIERLSARKSRLERTIETARGVMLMAMDKSGIPSITTPAGTFGIRPTAGAVQIIDESQIPARFWKPQDPKLDKAELKAALAEKEPVPGAALTNGGIAFFSRVK